MSGPLESFAGMAKFRGPKPSAQTLHNLQLVGVEQFDAQKQAVSIEINQHFRGDFFRPDGFTFTDCQINGFDPMPIVFDSNVHVLVHQTVRTMYSFGNS